MRMKIREKKTSQRKNYVVSLLEATNKNNLKLPANHS